MKDETVLATSEIELYTMSSRNSTALEEKEERDRDLSLIIRSLGS